MLPVEGVAGVRSSGAGFAREDSCTGEVESGAEFSPSGEAEPADVTERPNANSVWSAGADVFRPVGVSSMAW